MRPRSGSARTARNTAAPAARSEDISALNEKARLFGAALSVWTVAAGSGVRRLRLLRVDADRRLLARGDIRQHRQFDDEEGRPLRRADLADIGTRLDEHIGALVLGLAALPGLAAIGDRALDHIADLGVVLAACRN